MKTPLPQQQHDSINLRLYKELFEKRDDLAMFRVAQDIGTTNTTVRSWFIAFANQHKSSAKTPLKFSVPGAEYIVQMCQLYDLDLVYIMTGVHSSALQTPGYPVVTLKHREEKKETQQQSYTGTSSLDIQEMQTSITIIKERVTRIEEAQILLERKVTARMA